MDDLGSDSVLAHHSVVASGEPSTGGSLDASDHLSDSVLAGLLDFGENTSAEEDLGGSEAVGILLELEVIEDSLGGLLSILSIARNVGGEEIVSLHKLGVDDAVGETLSADFNSLKHTIATELIKNDSVLQMSSTLLRVGQDATHEVRIGALQGRHELGELLLVLGSYSDEAGTLLSGSLSGGGSSARNGGGLAWELGDGVGEETRDERVLGVLHGALEIVLEGVLILLEPAVGLIGNVASIVRDGEGGVGSLETRLLVFGGLALSVLGVELLDKGLVGGAGEHTLLIKQGEHTRSLGGSRCGGLQEKD